MIATINFTANPAVNYVVTYKEATSIVWITPPGNPTNSSPFLIGGLMPDTLYDFKIQTDCGIVTFQGEGTGEAITLWIEDTFTCEQDQPFNLSNTYTGFSSPLTATWDQISGRYYVVDADDSLGTFWWFNPDTITGFPSANHISGSITNDINTYAIDKVNRRIYSAGDNSGGMLVLNMATNVVSTLAYGVDSGPPGGVAVRAPIGLSSDKIYAFCKNPNVVRTYNRTTLAFIAEVNKSAIPSSSTYLSGGFSVQFVGSEIWVIAAARSEPKIARYNSDFTSLIGTITLPGVATAYSGLYWMGSYYDEANNKVYIGDIGSKKYFVIDSSTGSVLKNIQLTNSRGKSYYNFSFIKNELDGSIYMQTQGANALTDSTPNYKLYKINSSTGDIVFMYPNAQATTLSLRTGTSEQWGVNSGLVIWSSPNTGYNTDGLILKYT